MFSPPSPLVLICDKLAGIFDRLSKVGLDSTTAEQDDDQPGAGDDAAASLTAAAGTTQPGLRSHGGTTGNAPLTTPTRQDHSGLWSQSTL